jgi:hypothetical protein
MAEIKRGPTITTPAITHYGEWNAESRAVPALAFFEKYDAVVQACAFTGPSHDWFAPSAHFYANTGATYTRGDAIWEWMQSPALFGAYARVTPTNRVTTVLLGGDAKGDRLVHQQDMVFHPRGGGAGITVRRQIEFVSGPSEVPGQGTDGLQYFVGRTFWDTNVLTKELERRRGL